MSGRLAIVTGGASGIGRHLVEALCAAGYAVAFGDHAEAGAIAREAASLAAAGHRVMGAACDVGVRADVVRLLDAACDWHGGPPDLLVNNAGVQTWSPLLALADEDWTG